MTEDKPVRYYTLRREFRESVISIKTESPDPQKPPRRRGAYSASRQSGVTGVHWNQSAWVAEWLGKSKRKNRMQFSSSVHGEAEALRLAVAKRKEMEAAGVAVLRTPPASRQSGHRGVTWLEGSQSWRARIRNQGKEQTKIFAVKCLGDVEALRLAIEAKTKMGNSPITKKRMRAAKQSGHRGVIWSEAKNSWRVLTNRIDKLFPVRQFGEVEALRRAIAWKTEDNEIESD